VSVLVAACVVALAWDRFALLQHYRATRAVDPIAALTQRAWPAAAIARSNYLLLAEALREAAPPEGTVSVTTAMLALFPLSGLSPPGPGLADLNSVALREAADAQSLRAIVRACPPDVIMFSTRELPGRATVAEAMRGMPEYQPVARVETSRERDYGSFGGTIYRRAGGGDRVSGGCPGGLRFPGPRP